MKGRVWTLTQTDDSLWYHVYGTQERQRKGNDRKRKTIVSVQMENEPKRKFKREVKEEEEEEDPLAVTLVQDAGEEQEMLRDYFQLDVNLGELYNKWGAADPHFRSVANVFTGLCEGLEFYYTPIGNQAVFDRYILSLSPGVRMLRQDPVECLFSFICTSNNHISRIQGMVERLCQALGTPLCELDQYSYYSFPTLAALSGASSGLQTLSSIFTMSQGCWWCKALLGSLWCHIHQNEL